MKQITCPVFRDPANNGITPVWDKNCKVLLLGSVTASDGMRKGFYYGSIYNQLWELLDKSLNTTCFIKLKNQLNENYIAYSEKQKDERTFFEDRAFISNEFKKELLSRGIAMCDVFKTCYANCGSSLDQDIILNNPEYPVTTYHDELEYFLNNSSITTVIANSQFVVKQFEKMNIKGNFEVVYVPSPSPRKGAIDTKIDAWKDALADALNEPFKEPLVL